ncbi:MAG: DNA mismatch endonuclease Vsr [Ferruginibacter sp.]
MYHGRRAQCRNTEPQYEPHKGQKHPTRNAGAYTLQAHGYRYRLHDKKLPGKPDLVLRKYGTVIFIHGCFWHGHSDCKYYVVPKTRTDWWLKKINGNIANDEKAVKALKKDGWKIITVWECDLIPAKVGRKLERLLKKISN